MGSLIYFKKKLDFSKRWGKQDELPNVFGMFCTNCLMMIPWESKHVALQNWLVLDWDLFIAMLRAHRKTTGWPRISFIFFVLVSLVPILLLTLPFISALSFSYLSSRVKLLVAVVLVLNGASFLFSGCFYKTVFTFPCISTRHLHINCHRLNQC